MTKRERLESKISKNKEKIKALNAEIIELRKEGLLLSDKEQWYTEAEEEITLSKRPKKTAIALMGKVNWNEDFVDEDTGEVVTITRSQYVRKDGEWL